MSTPEKKKRREAELATLRRKLLETEAQLAHVYHFAAATLPKASRDLTLGSGILVRMHYLGGKEVCVPFVVKDGLSTETIEALMADIVRSYEKTIEFKPKGAV